MTNNLISSSAMPLFNAGISKIVEKFKNVGNEIIKEKDEIIKDQAPVVSTWKKQETGEFNEDSISNDIWNTPAISRVA